MKRFVFLLLFACGKSDGGVNHACDDLAGVVEAAAVKRVPDDSPADIKKMASEVGAKAGALIATRCAEDRWSQDMIDCAKTANDFATCKPKLTADQQMKLEDAEKQTGADSAAP